MSTLNQRLPAILGGDPLFDHPIVVGQLNLPAWNRIEDSFRGIFERQYYTNHGPLVAELEDKLCNFLGVKYAVCMTNATIALIIAAKALELKGQVICPAFTFAATPQSLVWAGLKPVFCDIDVETHQLDVESVAKLIDSQVSGILGVHLWGLPCSPTDLARLASKHELKLFFDSAHAFGCNFSGIPVGNFGELEVFSFHATKVLSATEGGCVCTNDSEIAAKLRNIRSSYGVGEVRRVAITGNGRMSEAQAAMALLSLEDYPQTLDRNRRLSETYRNLLREVPGIKLMPSSFAEGYNFQYFNLEILKDEFGISRNQLLNVLKAENILSRRYFYPGMHRTPPFCNESGSPVNSLPNTDLVCSRIMQLPVGQNISEDDVQKICFVIRWVHENHEKFKAI